MEASKTRESSLLVHTPIGTLVLEAGETGITRVEKVEKVQETRLTLPGAPGELVLACAGELSEYFAGKRTFFDLPLAPEGTPFQKRVWKALCSIPYGETRTYGEIAEMIGSPKAARAVGMANHNNPVMILIPCHRVIGADGSLTGYACGVEVKKRLLALEKGEKSGESDVR